MVQVINENEFGTATENGLCVVDFSATWCGPCRMLAPVLESLSQELEGKCAFFKVDVDENPALAMQYGISSIPALVVLKDGMELDTLVGFRPKDSLKASLEEYLD